MIIEIKLDDPKSCEGCPCYYDILECTLDMYDKDIGVKRDANYDVIRPQECIDKHGE